MIHDLDILQAVQQKFKERFPYPVYLQEVKEGFLLRKIYSGTD